MLPKAYGFPVCIITLLCMLAISHFVYVKCLFISEKFVNTFNCVMYLVLITSYNLYNSLELQYSVGFWKV